jgi:hypothetical protein
MLHKYFISKVREKTGSQVYYGPFATLNIPEKLVGYLTIGEMLGTYESCLHETFNKIISMQPQHLMIVGSNHGYYTAGLSYTIQPKSIIAYEMDSHLAEISNEWWRVNQLSPVTIKGEATEAEFRSMDGEVDFLLCDCEGAEDHLLDPTTFSWQKKSIILVELHDFYKPGITQRLIQKFKITHTTEILMDDFYEDDLNEKILGAVDINYRVVKYKIKRFPHHRWIMKNGKKVFAFGRFLALWPKQS